ncbi:MAG: hypothetical protein DI568_16520 [Sphingomonas sp.]|nr:MAG: hypothetical protein DI568_16520 [Sphingomonas sp.]
MNATLPASIGLGGDGDEILAIHDVERAFGVELDKDNAPNWHTAGDVFSSLRKALPGGTSDDSELWARFIKVLTQQTGVDPKTIERESPCSRNLDLGRISRMPLL